MLLVVLACGIRGGGGGVVIFVLSVMDWRDANSRFLGLVSVRQYEH